MFRLGRGGGGERGLGQARVHWGKLGTEELKEYHSVSGERERK